MFLDDNTCFYPLAIWRIWNVKIIEFLIVICTTSSLKQCDRLAIDYSGNKVKYEWYNSSGLLGNDRKSNDPRSGYVRRLRFRSTLGPFFDPFSPFDPFNSPDFISVLCSTLVSVVRGSFWVLSIFNTTPNTTLITTPKAKRKFSFDPRDNNHKTRDYDKFNDIMRGLRLNSRGFR